MIPSMVGWNKEVNLSNKIMILMYRNTILQLSKSIQTMVLEIYMTNLLSQELTGYTS